MDRLLVSPPLTNVLPTVALPRIQNSQLSNGLQKNNIINQISAKDLMEYANPKKSHKTESSKSAKMMSLSELIPHMFPDKTSVPLDQPPAKMSPPVLPTRKSSTVSPPTPENCESAVVLAITSTPFNQGTLETDRTSLLRQLSLLESFAGIKMSSFGNYVEKAINQDGFFAEKIDFPMTLGDNCGDMQEFARKAVSYSREIDSIIFNCRCRVGVKIAKIK